MVGVSSGDLSDDTTAALRGTRAGSVVLLGNSTAGTQAVRRLTDRVRGEAARPSGVELLVAADQEGGQVQRLRGPGFADIPSARRQADQSDAELADRAETWGRQLRDAGVSADLAPVADVVPAECEEVNEPIARPDRGYGSDPARVAGKTTAFVRGMDRAVVASASKHFPGLGRVRGNTDFAERVVDRSTVRGDATLRGFAATVRAGVDMLMVSSAFYAELDADRRAAFSSTILVGMLRQDLDFAGVVISDDLAARAVRDVDAGQCALRFLRAGGDLAIVGDPALASEMARAVRNRAADDPQFADRVKASAPRVLALKERRGLAEC